MKSWFLNSARKIDLLLALALYRWVDYCWDWWLYGVGCIIVGFGQVQIVVIHGQTNNEYYIFGQGSVRVE